MRSAPVALIPAGERPRSKFAPNAREVSCTGQGCEQRKQCLNYRRHAAARGQRWASFDIERRIFEDRKVQGCPAYVPA